MVKRSEIGCAVRTDLQSQTKRVGTLYRGLVTKSCTPTLRGQGDPKVSQPF